MRASIYIEGSGREPEQGVKALIDAGPEFRLQAVRAGIRALDGIFLTHSHADHLHGLDDVRPFCRNPLPVYGNAPTIEEMTGRFSYAFEATQRGGGKPKFLPQAVSGPVRLGGLTFTPVPVKHGILDIYGWEVADARAEKSFLYLTDTSAIPPDSLERLRKASRSRVIIIGGLRKRPHETHFTFEQAINTALEIGAEKIYLTHICHDFSHAGIEEICQAFQESQKTEIHPAWDGLELIL
jgi:phosphoribosyl 1,2-cyclic phosphate phosphodiesterase